MRGFRKRGNIRLHYMRQRKIEIATGKRERLRERAIGRGRECATLRERECVWGVGLCE